MGRKQRGEPGTKGLYSCVRGHAGGTEAGMLCLAALGALELDSRTLPFCGPASIYPRLGFRTAARSPKQPSVAMPMEFG